MTMDATFLEATKRVAHALRTGTSPRLKKHRRVNSPDPSARALRESGIPEKDIVTLIEGHRHEVAFVAGAEGPARFRADLPPRVDRALATFQEHVGTQDTGQLTMPPMTGWSAEGDGTYTHGQHGRLKLGAGKWTRHDASTGRILGSGVTQESLAAHLASLKAVGDRGGNTAASDGTDAAEAVLNRVRGLRPPVAVPEGTHARLAEALTRTARSAPASSGGGEDLHSRLRAAVTR